MEPKAPLSRLLEDGRSPKSDSRLNAALRTSWRYSLTAFRDQRGENVANMLNYLDWRGDLPITADPWNDVDSLIMASLCYINMPQVADKTLALREVAAMLPDFTPQRGAQGSFFGSCRALMAQCALSERFENLELHGYVNEVDQAREIQFSAVMADLPDGSRYVAFRGTDSTIVGWREDFSMAFETVPAQTAAAAYLEAAAKSGCRLTVGGHSKGGNLAVYAAAHVSPAAQSLIDRVYSFDGPGLDDETVASEGYARIAGKIRSFIPQSSVVGLLLAHHEEYVVVHSSSVSLLQHDPFSWQLVGRRFLEVEQVDRASQVVDQTVHAWLKQCSPEERELFVNTLFDLLESGKGNSVKDILTDLPTILGASLHVSPSTVWTMAQMIGRLLKIGAGNVRGLIAPKSEPEE